MRRSALVRKQETRRPWRRKPEDKVTPAVANRVAARDLAVGGCVMAHLDRTHLCHDKWGNRTAPDGVYEIDHVDNGGTGNRGPSESWNLVRLCPYAHRIKTENARLWRPLLRRYLDAVEPKAA